MSILPIHKCLGIFILVLCTLPSTGGHPARISLGKKLSEGIYLIQFFDNRGCFIGVKRLMIVE